MQVQHSLRPLCQAGGRRSPYLLSPPGRWTETWKTWSLGLGPIPPREAPSLPAPRLPTATDAGQPPPARGGKPRPPQPPPPALLPSLPLSRPPSLSPSLARCRSRALPRATCSGPNPGISEREKKRKDILVQKKERKTPNCIYFSCSEPGLASVPRSWPRPCPCGGVRGLLPRPRGPPRPTHCELHTVDRRDGHPNTTQTSRSFLQTQYPVVRLAAGLRPGTQLCSVRRQSTRAIHLVCALTPAPTPLPGSAPAGARSGCGLAPGYKPPPSHRTHTKPGALPLPLEAPSAAAAALHLFPKRAAAPRRARPWAPAEGAGEPGSQGSLRGSRIRGAEPEPPQPRAISEPKALLGELLPFPPSPTSLKHSHAESSAL